MLFWARITSASQHVETINSIRLFAIFTASNQVKSIIISLTKRPLQVYNSCIHYVGLLMYIEFANISIYYAFGLNESMINLLVKTKEKSPSDARVAVKQILYRRKISKGRKKGKTLVY